MEFLIINSITWQNIKKNGTLLRENPYLILGHLTKEQAIQIIIIWQKFHNSGLIIFREVYNYGFIDRINSYFQQKKKGVETIVFPKLKSGERQTTNILGGNFQSPLTKQFRMLLARNGEPFLFLRPKEVEFIYLTYLMYYRLLGAYIYSMEDTTRSLELDIEIVKKALNLTANLNLFNPKTILNTSKQSSYIDKTNPLTNNNLIKLANKINNDNRYWFIKQLKWLNSRYQLKTVAIYGLEDEQLVKHLSFLAAIRIFNQKEVVKIISPKLTVANEIYEAAKGSDALIFLKADSNYADISLIKLGKQVSKRIIIDNANIFSFEEMKAQEWLYISRGRVNVYNI